MIASELYRKGERKQPASRVYLFPVVLGLHSKIDAFKLTLKLAILHNFSTTQAA